MKKILISTVFLFMGIEVFASNLHKSTPEEKIRTSRYSAVDNVAPENQINPLKVIIKTRVPQGVITLRETVEFLLVRSGYAMADDVVMTEETKALLNLSIPVVHREIGPMSLDKALQMLGGEAFELIVDPVHRLISYELAENITGKIDG